MAIRQKTIVQMRLDATGETHARSKVRARDVEAIIDEPRERDGTNLGLPSTESLMASLIGCTNVISKRIAHGMGVEMGELDVALTANFDRAASCFRMKSNDLSQTLSWISLSRPMPRPSRWRRSNPTLPSSAQ